MNIKSILNAAALIVGLVGIYFKSQWWAGADLLILIGFGLLLISTVAFTIGENKAAGVPDSLNYLMVATLAVGIIGAVFKMWHWAGGNLLVLGVLVLMAVLSLMLIVSKATVTSSRQFLAVAFVYFTLTFAVVGLVRPRAATGQSVATTEAPAE
ncbi:hypothetical protein [Hymenobacter rubidus]|uniref:hypothetical protein n=1 Tax=Hymenobacter rubidus TaxID=1441626 RepID=UPI00191D3F20|nr:hypothetical protein [Hymenobacter rubidus]